MGGLSDSSSRYQRQRGNGPLEDFLTGLCGNSEDGSFVWLLAKTMTRWSAVDRLLTEMTRAELHRIAFRSSHGGFSACNLKAHYVLDEESISGGSAYILFALVGSTWTHVTSVAIRTDLQLPPSGWLGRSDVSHLPARAGKLSLECCCVSFAPDRRGRLQAVHGTEYL